MGIYRYKDVSYQWKFQHNGITHTGTFDTDSEREAKELFTLKKLEIRSGIKPAIQAEKITLLSTFIDEISPKRDVRNEGHILTSLQDYFAGRRLDEVTTDECLAWRELRLRQKLRTQSKGAKAKARSPRTVNREFSVLSGIFAEAVRQRRLGSNPCHGIAALKFMAKQPQIWTREQAARAIQWMVGEREHLLPLVLVALQTGLSRKDLFQLQVGQVQIHGAVGTIQKLRAKTGAQINIPLNSVALEILAPLVQRKRSSAFVFINRATGKPFTNIVKSLDTACRLAGVPRVTWHKLRHCVGTWLAEDGAGIEVIARFLAHSDYRTAPVYVQLAAEKVRPQAEQLGAWVKQNRENQNVKKTSNLVFPDFKRAS